MEGAGFAGERKEVEGELCRSPDRIVHRRWQNGWNRRFWKTLGACGGHRRALVKGGPPQCFTSWSFSHRVPELGAGAAKLEQQRA